MAELDRAAYDHLFATSQQIRTESRELIACARETVASSKAIAQQRRESRLAPTIGAQVDEPVSAE
jgi:hypothetical protein